MWLRWAAARSLTKGQLKRRAQHAEGLYGHAALLTHQSPVHQTHFAAAADKARWPHWSGLLKHELLDNRTARSPQHCCILCCCLHLTAAHSCTSLKGHPTPALHLTSMYTRTPTTLRRFWAPVPALWVPLSGPEAVLFLGTPAGSLGPAVRA